MQRQIRITTRIVGVFGLVLLVGCQGASNSPQMTDEAFGMQDNPSASSASAPQFSIEMGAYDDEVSDLQSKGRPLSAIDQVRQVWVNVTRVEVTAGGSTRVGRLIVRENIGPIDLMALKSKGLVLPISNLSLPHGVRVHQIRLVLAPNGNELRYADGNRCILQTPSQQQSGLKIVFQGGGVSLERNHDYSVAVDFDLKKSLVFQGNGKCLLKPVIHTRCLRCHRSGDRPNCGLVPVPDGTENPDPVVNPTPAPAPMPDPDIILDPIYDPDLLIDLING